MQLINVLFVLQDYILQLEVLVGGVTFAVALLGNSAVLMTLLLRKQKINRMYYFILHLSIADLLVAFLNILPQMIWDITWRFQGNDFLCKSVKFFQVFSMYLSAWILVINPCELLRTASFHCVNY